MVKDQIYICFLFQLENRLYFSILLQEEKIGKSYIYYFCGKIAINFLKIIWNLQNLYIFVNIPLAMQIKALKINLNTSIFNEYSHFKEINFLKENIFCDAF